MSEAYWETNDPTLLTPATVFALYCYVRDNLPEGEFQTDLTRLAAEWLWMRNVLFLARKHLARAWPEDDQSFEDLKVNFEKLFQTEAPLDPRALWPTAEE